MKKNLLLTVLLLFTSIVAMAQLQTHDLRCENLVNPLGIDNLHPHFSWKLTASYNGDRQTAYELQVATTAESLAFGNANVWDSGKMESEASVMVDYAGPTLQQKGLYYWRVKTWNANGSESDWSETQCFSIGILDNAMPGEYIGISELDGEQKSPLVRKQININTDGKVFAHINSLGYHELYVNGNKVGNHVLQPAVSQLDRHSLIVTYDITPYIIKGDNDIVMWLGQGWYRSNVFHTALNDAPLVKAEFDQLTPDGWSVIDVTDNTWQVSASGYWDTGRWDGLGFGGERIDGARIPHTMTTAELDTRDWHKAQVKKVTGMAATPQMFCGNRIAERIEPVSVTRQTDGSWLVDMGKVFTGWLQVRFPGMKLGDGFKVEYTDNIMPGKTFESQGESDSYSSCGIYDYDTFSNKFHHHVMRYALITPFEEALEGDVLAKPLVNKAMATLRPEIIGLMITGTEEAESSFSCNDEDINQIHDMIHHTVKNLTLNGYMVDCAHLERQGYGGDGNSSTMALQTMYYVPTTYYNWMQAWSEVMEPDGSLPYVAPAGGGGGGPYWCEFFIKAPWRTYLNYGDKRMLEMYYDQAKLWLDYVGKYSTDNLLTPWPDNDIRVWWLGEWVAPNGVDCDSQSTKNLVNNCVVSDAYQTMVKIAEVLGRDEDIAGYLQKIEDVNGAILNKYYNDRNSTIGAGTPLDMSFAMLTGIIPDDKKQQVKEKLLSLQSTKYKDHIAVGLIGTHIFTDWATKEHEADMMMTILKQRDYPGYLYMIDNGATGTWEYWDGQRSHLHNCYNGIGTWFYQAVAGIVPDENAPGYKHFIIDPQFPAGITNAKATKPTAYGDISVEWTKTTGAVDYVIDIPVGVTATLVTQDEPVELESGHHEILSFETNGISSTESGTCKSGTAIYCITGQRVNNSFKGIIIRNGRKEVR